MYLTKHSLLLKSWKVFSKGIFFHNVQVFWGHRTLESSCKRIKKLVHQSNNFLFGKKRIFAKDSSWWSGVSGSSSQWLLKLLWTVYSEGKLQSCLKLRNFQNPFNKDKSVKLLSAAFHSLRHTMHKKRPKICTCCRVSEAKFY